MRTPNYIKLADCSRIVLSWLCVFAAVGAYLSFAGHSRTDILLFFAAYMTICMLYVYVVERKAEKIRMSYLMHPMFLSGIFLGLFITVVEDDGKNILPISLYIVFIAAGYMINYYLSSFVQSLTGASISGVGIILKNSRRQHKVFAAWLVCFIIASLLMLLVPTAGFWKYIVAWIRGMLGDKNKLSQPEEYTSQPVMDEEVLNSYVSDTSGSGSLLHVLLALLLVNLVLIIIVIARKIIFKEYTKKDSKEKQQDDIIEEISEVRYPVKQKEKAEVITGPASIRVRKFFSKTIRSYYNKRVDSSKTPTQLLACDKEQEKELRDIYHKARYSHKEVTADDAGRAKELSGVLIKERNKTKKYNI